MSIPVVTGTTCVETWQRGCELVVNGHGGNLVSLVNDPASFDDDWLSTYNPNSAASYLSDVVNTIFPRKLWTGGDREEFYRRYLELHERKGRLSGKKVTRWGTYFQRMTAFGQNRVNQLEEIIQVIRNERRHFHTFNPIHISSTDYDSLRKRMGNPCLQYIQFLQPSHGELDLLAVYRNHDFLHKALGNYIGLAFLLQFVCASSGKEVGRVMCHSAAIYADNIRFLRETSKIG